MRIQALRILTCAKGGNTCRFRGSSRHAGDGRAGHLLQKFVFLCTRVPLSFASHGGVPFACSFPGAGEGVKIAGQSQPAAAAAAAPAAAAGAAAADDDDDMSDSDDSDDDMDFFGEMTPEEQKAAEEKKELIAKVCCCIGIVCPWHVCQALPLCFAWAAWLIMCPLDVRPFHSDFACLHGI